MHDLDASPDLGARVVIYTDGACKGNPGPGGWGVWLTSGKHEREMSGGEALTTNNRMELTAVIEGLTALKEPCDVVLFTDSEYARESPSRSTTGSHAVGRRLTRSQ